MWKISLGSGANVWLVDNDRQPAQCIQSVFQDAETISYREDWFGLWGTLKTELVYRRHFHTRAQAKNTIFAYIEGWYNRQRRHSLLGYLSPEQFAQQFQP